MTDSKETKNTHENPLTDYMDNSCVIIDNGSGLIKCGLATNAQPLHVRSVVGRPRVPKILMGGEDQTDCYVGPDLDKFRGILTLDYPIQHGIVTNWDDMEKLWQHVYFKTLNVLPEEQPVIVTEAPLNPRAHREKLASVFFEKFEVPALYVGTQAVLSLYAGGRVNGLVVDSGDGVTHIVPIYEGYVLPHAILKMNIAGHTLTKYLFRLLNSSGYTFSSTADFEIVREIKESVCYVCSDFKAELNKFYENPQLAKRHVLPDGSEISVDSAQFRCPEVLFNPNLLGIDKQGLHYMVCSSILDCDIDVRKRLFENIVLSGGSTMFPGIKERLQKEVMALSHSKALTVKVEAKDERKFHVWMGAAILSALPQFSKELCVTKQEYNEKGPRALTKFF